MNYLRTEPVDPSSPYLSKRITAEAMQTAIALTMYCSQQRQLFEDVRYLRVYFMPMVGHVYNIIAVQ